MLASYGHMLMTVGIQDVDKETMVFKAYLRQVRQRNQREIYVCESRWIRFIQLSKLTARP